MGPSNIDYKAAYLRQKQARQKAESLLESRSSELYESNMSLQNAYEKLKNQKSQMFQQEKLASIGQLASGVAHEINNPTGYVKSNLSSLQRYIVNIKGAVAAYHHLASQLADSDAAILQIQQQFDLGYILEDIDELVGESVEGLARIEGIVKSLKNFARPDAEEFILFDINDCIENTIKLVNKDITLKGHLSKELTANEKALGQPNNISQVILNLLVNATQAIQQNGTIKIKSYDDKNGIIVTVEDNGCGIESKDLTNIFDPFFSTKEVGIGTGLGLSVSHGIIRKHNGQLSVDSTPGEGTIFTLFLPNSEPIKTED